MVGTRSRSRRAGAGRGTGRNAAGRPSGGSVGGGLFGDEPGEELDMRPVVGAGFFGEQRERRASSVEMEVAEIGLDLLVEPGAGAHARSSTSTSMP